jgi:hypothetical protein
MWGEGWRAAEGGERAKGSKTHPYPCHGTPMQLPSSRASIHVGLGKYLRYLPTYLLTDLRAS